MSKKKGKSGHRRRTAKLIPFPKKNTRTEAEKDDDIVEPDTCILLLDMDPEIIARRLADKPWSDRVLFFNNVITESLDKLGKTVELFDAKPGKMKPLEYMEIATIGMHAQICDVLDIWGVDVPPDKDAAKLFALSISPEHRMAASVFCGRSQGAIDRLFEPATGLMVFKHMSELSRPGLSEVWRHSILGEKREGGAS